VEAVRRSKFEPARRNGRAVSSRFTMSFAFHLLGGDSAEFFRLSEKAATGDPEAEFALAKAFFEGREIPRDDARGMALLARAARGGLADAQLALGERLWGDGHDAAELVPAYVWFALAQRKGVAAAGQRAGELEARMSPAQRVEAHRQLADQIGRYGR
jgi:TPR repeat protein